MSLSHKRTQALILLSVAVLVVLTLAFRPAQDLKRRERPLAQVVVAPAQQVDVAPMEILSGRLEPARSARLRFEVAGRVEQRQVEPGMSVAAGDPLLVLAAGDWRDAAAEARAQYELEQGDVARDTKLLKLARENVQLARAEVERLDRLGQQLSSRSQLDQARRAVLQLEAEVARLQALVDGAAARLARRRATLERAERNLARTRLSAPFAGVVNAVYLDVGDYAASNTLAVELVDIAELDLYLEVRGAVAAALQLGQEIPLRLDDRHFHGRLHALQASPATDTFTHALQIRLAAAAAARPGAMVAAELPLRPLAGVLTVPVTAVLREEGRAFVFAVRDGRLHKRAAQLGPRVQDRVVLFSGLAAGEPYVQRDVAALSDGQQVQAAAAGD